MFHWRLLWLKIVSDLSPKFLSWTEPDIDRRINRTPAPDIWTGLFTKKTSQKGLQSKKGTFIRFKHRCTKILVKQIIYFCMCILVILQSWAIIFAFLDDLFHQNQNVRLMGSSQKSGLSWTGLLSGSKSSKLMSGSVRSLTSYNHASFPCFQNWWPPFTTPWCLAEKIAVGITLLGYEEKHCRAEII